MTDVEFQRMRANVYRDEVLDSHDVIDRLQKESETYRVRINEQNTCLENLQDENRKLKGEIIRIKKMLEAVLDS
jgi:predicted RNase H-like nuclease (RuvC/YqgF family)